jgi:hypothetical protein
MDLTMMVRVGDRWEKMEGSCSTGQSPQRAVVPVEEEEEEAEASNFSTKLAFAKTTRTVYKLPLRSTICILNTFRLCILVHSTPYQEIQPLRPINSNRFYMQVKEMTTGYFYNYGTF